ncbi:MAG: hypothetical protein LBG59_09570 [Candidatus Peribacteria bacterium]|nr:hypothetical protein [Candidatus Peribacteria bacterium]
MDPDAVSLERRMKTTTTKKLLEQLGKTKAKQILTIPEALEILLFPRFCVRHSLTDEEVIQPDIEQQVLRGFTLLKPFNDFLLEAF